MPRRRVREAQTAQAFDEAVDEHLQFIYGCMIGWVQDRDRAFELTQETFTRAAESWVKYDPRRGNARQWLTGIARHVRDDHFRSLKQDEVRLKQLEEVASEDPWEDVAEPINPDLRRAFLQLSDADRDLLWQLEVMDVPLAEVARSLRIKRSACSMRRKRALRRVRDLMKSVNDA